MIAVIDYAVGNLFSISKALERAGARPIVTNDPRIVLEADAIVMPGVGAFGAAIRSMRERGIHDIVLERVDEGIPVLGICLGMQLLGVGSEESPEERGFGILNCMVRRLRGGGELKIPHMGWNTVEVIRDSELLEGLGDSFYAYFVHSYYLDCPEGDFVIGKTWYGIEFPSVIHVENVFGTQFHPEKSGRVGLEILRNFVRNIVRR